MGKIEAQLLELLLRQNLRPFFRDSSLSDFKYTKTF